MTETEMSVIENRIKTIEDLYSRNNTIEDISEKTGLSYSKVQRVLANQNFFHGIKRTEGTKNHPLKPLTFYKQYEYLLEADKIDSLR